LKKFLSAALLVLIAIPSFGQSIDDLIFVTEDYPPFNFSQKGISRGISVDALLEMLALAGSKKTRGDINVWPWARGYETALNEKNTVLFSTTRTAARENLFKWVGPIMPARNVLIAKKSSAIKINALKDLNHTQLKIGVVREDIGAQLLLDAGVAKDRTHQANSGISVAKMLHAGRVDLWAYGAPVILWNLKELGYPTNEYEEVFTLSDSQQYYFALHKSTDDKLVAKLQKALNELKKNGRFNQIVARYR
jgi:polar amino acid transport system substrate-binding protein